MMAGDVSSILSIRGLKVTFNTPDGPVRALDAVDLDVMEGESLAIMGESGCGKSVLGHASMRLLDDVASVSGSVKFHGRDLYGMDRHALEGLRGGKICLIPQSPSTSFNPVIKIGAQIRELIEKSGVARGDAARKKALQALASAGFSDPEMVYGTYPHRLSGGMCERALIAMAVSAEPELIIADEPTKGLDGQAKKTVLGLLRELSGGTTLVMITHDFKAAAVCERMAVMYAGEIIEEGRTSEILGEPGHYYLRGLLDAQPSRGMKPIGGGSPSLAGLGIGCRFRERCEAADEACVEHPGLISVNPTHKVRCHNAPAWAGEK